MVTEGFDHVRAELGPVTARKGEVWINGAKVNGVRRLEVTAGFDEITLVILEFESAVDLEVLADEVRLKHPALVMQTLERNARERGQGGPTVMGEIGRVSDADA